MEVAGRRKVFPQTLMAERPMVSVIAAMYNEGAFIDRFAGAMLAQDYESGSVEVLLVDGGSTDGTLARAEALAASHSIFRVLHNPDRYQPQARNVGIQAARGELIAITDMHADYPPDYLSNCLKALKSHDTWCVGGVLTTRPSADTAIAKGIAAVQSHRFGVGNSPARIGAQAREVDSLAFPFLPRAVYRQVGLYNELMPRHEDTDLYARMRRAGGSLMVDPTISAVYYARATVRGLLRQAWGTGRENLMACLFEPASVRARHWAPMAFVLSLIALGAAAFFWMPAAWALLAEASLYALAATAASLQVGARIGWQYTFVVWPIFVLHHLSYGLGSLAGAIASLWQIGKVRRYRFPVLK